MQQTYADVNGIRMHYVTQGTGEPILFLHGFPEYWGVWKQLLAEFSKDHQVIAPDLRGYNKTSRPTQIEQYSIQNLVADVKGLVDHLGLKKVTVVSQDWGALLGWSFVLRHPERVRHLITINITHPALFNRDLREDPQQQQASQYMLLFRSPGGADAISANDYAFMRQAVFADARQHGATLTEADEAEWLQMLKAPGALDAGLNYYRAAELGPPDGQGSKGGSNILDDLPEEKWKTSFPVLILWGEQETHLLQSGLVGLEKFVPDLTIRKIPGATHWVTLQKPALVIQHIREFLARKS